MEIDRAMSQVYQCCFCGRSIDPEFPDVGGLRYSTTVHAASHDHPEQQLYCHTLCLLDRLHPSTKLYVLDAAGEDE
jgi:hypothetical protein